MGWNLLCKDFDTHFEMWKTPAKYLICRKYEGFYKFFDHQSEAYEAYKRILESKKEYKV